MTNPNLVNTSQVYMRSNVQIPISGSFTDILECPASSNMIIRADTVTICNTTNTAVSITVDLLQGTGFSTTRTSIAKNIEIPAYSSMVVLDKDYPIYLEETNKIQVASSGPGLQAICSYTIISDTSITLPGRPVINQLPVTFAGLSGSKGEVSGNFELPAISNNQMIVLTERANSTTPPALRSGFTDITTAINTSVTRSMRIQYRIGGGSETITTSTSASYIVVDNATTIGAISTTGAIAGSSTTPTIPGISGLVNNEKSLVYAASYYPTVITNAGSPYTVISGVGGYLEGVASTSISQTNFTTSLASFIVSAVVEFRP